MAQENAERKLQTLEDSLIDSMHSFIGFAELSSSQVESLYLLLNDFYRHGLACADTNSRNDLIYRLQDEVRKYLTVSQPQTLNKLLFIKEL